jgi:hypothetical protein
VSQVSHYAPGWREAISARQDVTASEVTT